MSVDLLAVIACAERSAELAIMSRELSAGERGEVSNAQDLEGLSVRALNPMRLQLAMDNNALTA